MPGPPLALTLTPRQPLVPGDEVRGTVEVLDDLPRAHHLEVALVMSGRRVGEQERVRESPAMGPFTRGQTVPFALRIPLDAPLSYEGEDVSIEWTLLARADVPWAVDPVVREPLLIAPRTVRTEEERLLLFRELDAEARAMPEVAKWIVLVVVLALFLPMLIMLTPIIAPIALALWAKAGLIRTRLRDFDLEAPDRALLGDALPAIVSFELRRPVDVESIRVVLEGKEHWVTGSGKHRQHHSRTIHSQEVKLAGPCVLAPAGPGPARFLARTVLQLPPGGPATVARGNVTSWEVTARAELVGWPDPSKTLKVLVAAARGAAPVPEIPETPEQSSTGVVFVPRGEAGPAGVDVSTAASPIWPWLLMPFAGGALVALDGVLWFGARIDVGAHALSAAGVFLLVVGIAGTIWKIVR